MNVERLKAAGVRRARTRTEAKAAYAHALDVVLEELAGDTTNVAEAARLANVARQTVYNELERRAPREDTPA